jgi:glycosyltransferase involved in cell wall biosynthesis
MPIVSVIVPCYNEQATIRMLLEALYQQSYPRGEMEVIIADGLSTDRTRQVIAEFQIGRPDLPVHVIDNPGRTTPAGLNRAIAAASGRVLVRLDAHTVPDREYVAGCVKDLEQNMGALVGGIWQIRPSGADWLARAIAAAAAHPLAVGDALYRFAARSVPAQAVDTVPFGAFCRELVKRIGGFDETLATNEDYEFNVRVRQSGGRVWLDPAIRSTYFARGSLGALARQYWRYGYWKARMLRRYPRTLRWRQALPPLFVLGLASLILASLWLPSARVLLALSAAIYLLIAGLAGAQMAVKNRDFPLLFGAPLAIGVMHFCWGAAFLWSSLVSYLATRKT